MSDEYSLEMLAQIIALHNATIANLIDRIEKLEFIVSRMIKDENEHSTH